MFVGIFWGAEEGYDLRTWDELRMSRRIFYTGAAVALIAPMLAYLAGRLRWTAAEGKPEPWDDLA